MVRKLRGVDVKAESTTIMGHSVYHVGKSNIKSQNNLYNILGIARQRIHSRSHILFRPERKPWLKNLASIGYGKSMNTTFSNSRNAN